MLKLIDYRVIQYIDSIPKMGIKDAIEILLLTFLIFYIISKLSGTRIWIVIKSAIIIFILYIIAYVLNLNVIVTIFNALFMFIVIATTVAIQPEIRKVIESISNNKFNKSIKSQINDLIKNRNKKVITRISNDDIQELIKGCSSMSKVKTGALIAIEGSIPLNDYIESGIKIDSNITGELLINIFEKNTPLHDGAVIIRNGRIMAATCYFPLSNSKSIDKSLGTRHRAAIGLSEITDALIIVVSEETGHISTAYKGKLKTNLDRDALFNYLHKYQVDTTVIKTIKIEPKSMLIKLPFFLLSAIISFVIWMMIINSTNPVMTKTLTGIPITFINEDIVEESGKAYDVLSDNTVNIKFRDTKDIIDNISPNDIEVVADFSKISFTNSIPLEVVMPDYPNIDYTLSQQSIEIEIEDLATTEMNINIKYIGETQDNHYISEVILNKDTIVISGPKSVIQTINNVVVEINRNNITESTVLQLTPLVYDRNGNILNNSKINMSIDEVKATVVMYNTKDVTLNIGVNITDKIVEKLLDSIEYSTDKATIAGPDEILNETDEITFIVDINSTLDDIASNSLIKNIALQSYLDEGLYAIKDTNNISINLKLKDYTIKTIEFSSKIIDIVNNSEYNVDLTDRRYSITLLSTNVNISDLNINNLKPYVEIPSDIKNGQELDIKFKYYGDYVVAKATANAIVREKDE